MSESKCKKGIKYVRSNLHNLMIGLFYPAVLGTIFYSIFPLIIQMKLILLNPLAFILIVVLFIHFCADYVFTIEVNSYNYPSFVLNLIILYFVYLAFENLIFSEKPPNEIMEKIK